MERPFWREMALVTREAIAERRHAESVHVCGPATTYSEARSCRALIIAIDRVHQTY